jgi:CRP-like cAMP-binding protein
VKTIKELLLEHNFFHGMKPEYLELLAGCGKNHHFRDGEYLFREGEDATQFFVVRSGRVSLEAHDPLKGSVVVQTEGEGEVVGWSWLFPPYKCVLDAKAIVEVSAIVLDGRCMLAKCEQDPALGYDLMKRFALIVAERLQNSRIRLLDMYNPSVQG